MQEVQVYHEYMHIYIVISYLCLSFLSINIVEFCTTLSKFDLPTLHQGGRERKNATEHIEI